MIKEISQKEWSSLVPKNKKNPFQDEFWESGVSSNYPYLKIRHFLYRDNFLVRVADLGARITGIPFSDGGDLVSINNSPINLSDLKKDIQNFLEKPVNLYVHSYFCPVEPSEVEAGILDFRVSLSIEEEMMASFRKTLRHIIRDSGDADISIAKTKEERSEAYRLYLKTMRSAMNLAMTRDLFETLGENLFVYKNEGEVEAFSVFLSEGEKVFYTLSGSSEKAKKENAPHHLLWYAMKRYANSGAQEMFLGGARTDSALVSFKRGWRGEEYPIYELSRDGAKDKTRNSPARTLWKLMPTFLMPWASRVLGRRFF